MPKMKEGAPASEAPIPILSDSAANAIFDIAVAADFASDGASSLLHEFEALLDAYDDSADELELESDGGVETGLCGLDYGGKAELRLALRRWAQKIAGRLEMAGNDLHEAQARITTLERLADEDALLPIANRRAFIRELTRLIALARRHGTVSSLIYIDLNDMKGINDAHGHNAGDAALQHVAHLLIDHVRQADIVGRLGGDEFGLLLVRTDQAGAEQKAASLARAVAARPLPWNTRLVPLSIAFGAHCFDGHQDAAAVMETADALMYRNKQKSRQARHQAGADDVDEDGKTGTPDSACSST